MPFVKLDCGILDSTLWVDREAREVFVTALLMAEPWEIKEPTAQINVRDLGLAGFKVPPGWYGFVHAAGTGIVRRSGLSQKDGLDALERLGAPDPESRSHDFDGRRLVRVDSGFVILNYDKYRKRDYTNADRQARFRERERARNAVSKDHNAVTSRRVTQAEEEVDAELNTEMSTSPSSAASPAPDAAHLETIAALTEDQIDEALKRFPRWWKPELVPEMHRKAQATFARDFDGFTDVLDKAYPEVDIYAECAAAYAWEEANNKKTPGGRKRFLRSWMEKANNSGRYRKPRELGPYTQGGASR